MDGALPVEFSVKYRLGEYLRIVSAHAFATTTLKDASGWRRTAYKAMLVIICSMLFFYKSHRVGACHFIIDGVAISRTSKDGTSRLPWPEVVAVYQYDVGYLIAKDKGAMPIPFRVLSDPQRKTLAVLVAPHLCAA